MQQMEPQRRLGSSVVKERKARDTGQLNIASRRQNRGEIHGEIEQLRIDLSLLHWQVTADPMAMRFAIAWLMRIAVIGVAIVIRVVTTTAIRVRLVRTGDFTSARYGFVITMPTAAHHCMNQQREGNQAGEHVTHEILRAVARQRSYHCPNRSARQSNFDKSRGQRLQQVLLEPSANSIFGGLADGVNCDCRELS